MIQAESLQVLWERVRKPGLDLEALSAILDELQRILEDIAASDAELRSKLRMQREELPDLRRLITKKHDAILQGRLQDSIGKIKRLLAAPEASPAETPESNEDGTNGEEGAAQQERKPFRNMPNLGMD